MNTGNWGKRMDMAMPYVEWNSIAKKHRTKWDSVCHSNIAMELHIILEGEGEAELNDRRVKVREGQALLIMPHTFHTCRNTTKPFLRLTTSFIWQDQAVLQEKAGQGLNYIVMDINKDIRGLCYDILKEYDHGKDYLQNEIISAMFFRLLIYVLRILNPKSSEEEEKTEKAEMLRVIDRYFSSLNIQNGSSRKELAEELHCSERQLNRILENLCGMNFVEKRTLARMAYAKYLLRNTDARIGDITAMVGYSNEASFYKAFRQKFGMTPQDFREKYGDVPEENADSEKPAAKKSIAKKTKK